MVSWLHNQGAAGGRWAVAKGTRAPPCRLAVDGGVSIPRMVAAEPPGRVEEGVGGGKPSLSSQPSGGVTGRACLHDLGFWLVPPSLVSGGRGSRGAQTKLTSQGGVWARLRQECL